MSLGNLLVPNNYKIYADTVQLGQTSSTIAATATVTAAEILGGIIQCSSAAATVLTLPNANLLVAAFPGVVVGDILQCLFVNYGPNTVTIISSAGATTTVLGAPAIATMTSRLCYFRFTNVTASTEAVVMY